MAIQLPNAGLGDGKTGDNEFVMWTKVKDNFTDPTNAASKLVGNGTGQIPLAENVRGALNTVLNGHPSLISLAATGETLTPDDFLDGKLYYKDLTSTDPATYPKASEVGDISFVFETSSFWSARVQTGYGYKSNEIIRRTKPYSKTWTAWAKFLTTANTTKDSNGFLKGASPIVKVHADKVVLNEEAEEQNITFKKNGIGDYTITTQSGLSTDGWYIELPKDMNGNPKVAVTLEETDGVISLKSYKRIFSMETFTFVPDLESPLDIPETRWIDLRLNEIPVDPSELEMEV